MDQPPTHKEPWFFSSATFLFYFLPIVLAGYFLVVPFPRLRNGVLLVASLVFYAYGEGTYLLVMLASIVANYTFGLWVPPGPRALRCQVPDRGGHRLQPALAGRLQIHQLPCGQPESGSGPGGTVAPGHGAGCTCLSASRFSPSHCISYLMDIYPPADARPAVPADDGPLYLAFPPARGPAPSSATRTSPNSSPGAASASTASPGAPTALSWASARKCSSPTWWPCRRTRFSPFPPTSCPRPWPGSACCAIPSRSISIFRLFGHGHRQLGHMFGFKFMENFNYPYISRSIRSSGAAGTSPCPPGSATISTSPWAATAPARLQPYRNLVTVFFLCGLCTGPAGISWSGACSTACSRSVERVTLGRRLSQWPRIVAHAYTLLVVMVAWVFFRAETLPGALAYLRAMAGFPLADGAGLAGRILPQSPRPPSPWAAA